MANGDNQVEVYSPQGQYGTIPSSQMAQALAQGYKPKDSYVEAIHPKTGATGIIPKEQWPAAQAQGYLPAPAQQAKQQMTQQAAQTVQPIPQQSPESKQFFLGLAGTGAGATGGTAAAGIAAKALPSASRAGATLNEIKGAVGTHTMDVSEAGNTALRAKQIAESGGRMPKVMMDFLRRATDPEKGPVTFAEGRDFYTNATKMASEEFTKLTGPMKAQMAEFTQKLGTALNEVTARAGRAEEFQNAMEQYANAMKLKGAVKTGGEFLLKKALPAAAAGYVAERIFRRK